MNIFVDTLSTVLLIGGGFFVIVGGIGILRLPDVYTRLHAASVTDTLGVILIVAGLMVQAGWTLITVKLLLILLFLLFTSPVASHALARAALSDGVKPILGKESPLSKS